MDDRALMDIQADTSCTYDARGRMLRGNEPREDARWPAPRLFLGRTTAGDVVRFGAALPDAVVRRFGAMLERQLPSGAPAAPPAPLAAVREALARHASITAETGGPAYRFPPSLARSDEAVRLTDGNRRLARDTYPWLYDEIGDRQPCFGVVRDGAVVSVCFSSRIGVAAAAAAGVETLPAFRGHGYAAAVTAAWGASIKAEGRIPLHGTAWDNVASQGVARRLGLIMFGTETTWT